MLGSALVMTKTAACRPPSAVLGWPVRARERNAAPRSCAWKFSERSSLGPSPAPFPGDAAMGGRRELISSCRWGILLSELSGTYAAHASICDTHNNSGLQLNFSSPDHRH